MSAHQNDDVPEIDAIEQFRRADALFDAALNLDSTDRLAYVNAETLHDDALRQQVIGLLIAYDSSADFLEGPAVPDALMQRLQLVLSDAYRLRRRLAAGGMATVYLADDKRHQRQVAVKVFESSEITGNAPSSEDTAKRSDAFSLKFA